MRITLTILCAGALAILAGCTTEAAKKAMDKPMPVDQYSGFDAHAADKSKRKAERPKPVPDDTEPDKAVDTLVKQLQGNDGAASFAVTAEEQLAYWGGKPGVGQIVVRKVRPLLKNKSIEQRAPALRLTLMFGGDEITGDLIECLADNDYGIRDLAYRGLQQHAPGINGIYYDPQGTEVARAQSVKQMERWWQDAMRKGAVQPPSIYEKNGVPPPPTETTSRNTRTQQNVSER